MHQQPRPQHCNCPRSRLIDAVAPSSDAFRVLTTPLERRKRGVWKRDLENATLSRNLRAMACSGIGTERGWAPCVSLVGTRKQRPEGPVVGVRLKSSSFKLSPAQSHRSTHSKKHSLTCCNGALYNRVLS